MLLFVYKAVRIADDNAKDVAICNANNVENVEEVTIRIASNVHVGYVLSSLTIAIGRVLKILS